MNSEIQMCVEELVKVYGSKYLTSNDCLQAKHFFWRLEKVCETIDEFLYVITNVTHSRKSNRLLVFVRSAAARAETVEHVRIIWPLMPSSWKDERRILLRKAADASTSRDELHQLLLELEII